MITLTQPAVERIREILEHDPSATGKSLRLSVQGGGCAGFQYAFSFDAQQGDDTVVEQDGLEIVIDPMSSIYLMGLQIDYTEDLNGAGFRFLNPNSSGSCGCGKSFAV
jgi:iron-sulfur cluster insertion protein